MGKAAQAKIPNGANKPAKFFRRLWDAIPTLNNLIALIIGLSTIIGFFLLPKNHSSPKPGISDDKNPISPPSAEPSQNANKSASPTADTSSSEIASAAKANSPTKGTLPATDSSYYF